MAEKYTANRMMDLCSIVDGLPMKEKQQGKHAHGVHEVRRRQAFDADSSKMSQAHKLPGVESVSGQPVQQLSLELSKPTSLGRPLSLQQMVGAQMLETGHISSIMQPVPKSPASLECSEHNCAVPLHNRVSQIPHQHTEKFKGTQEEYRLAILPAVSGTDIARLRRSKSHESSLVTTLPSRSPTRCAANTSTTTHTIQPKPQHAPLGCPTPLHPEVRLRPPAIPPAIVPPPRRGLSVAVNFPKQYETRSSEANYVGPSEPLLTAAQASAAGDTIKAAEVKERIVILGSTLSHKAQLDSSTRQYSCDKCGRAFFRRSDFVRHFQIHLDIKPNHCPMCGKAFIQRSALTVHVRVHTGEKPYSCKVCGRQFSDSSSLARHRRIHLRQQAGSSVAQLSVLPQEDVHSRTSRNLHG